MIRYIVGATVQILRATPIPDRFNLDETSEDWENPIPIGPKYHLIPIAPQQLVDAPFADQPLRQSDTIQAILPYGVPIKGTDRIRVLTGPYAGDYQLNGQPSHWQNPFTGWAPGCIVTLKAIP